MELLLYSRALDRSKERARISFVPAAAVVPICLDSRQVAEKI
jgi:hypothetical protein